MRSSGLPPPSPDALASSARLSRLIAQRIAAAGGWVGFDTYMQWALYEPGLGYYSGGSRKFGAEGDFVTAPELGPLFGTCIAAQCAQWFAHVPRSILEFGAGSGALAAQVLTALEARGIGDVDYAIVELSGELRARQAATLAERVPHLAARVRWLDAWPDTIRGVVLGNELLDAMPARVFGLAGSDVVECGVAVASAGSSDAGDPDAGDSEDAPRLCWAERPAEAGFAQRVRARLAQAWDGPAQAHAYIGELGEQAEAWIRQLADRLVCGAVLLLDYGFPRHEFYHPQRHRGTLMCHYRHRAHTDPFLWPGLQDLTVHVDFTAIAESARGGGLDLLGYTTQARLLLDLGLLDEVQRSGAPGSAAYVRATRAVHTLISDAEMGELFKAIAFGRGVPDDALGFRSADRRAVLSAGAPTAG
ncbi:MAG TPA: SAM-dependent methyltransferase [Quisquiliibacterium sp.]|nr:SAM-dependent methyltransferase [Quisquiliibacterium sp.]